MSLVPEKCKGMTDIRREIDYLDHTIIQLIGQRFDYVKAAAKFKTSEDSVKAPHRFEQVIKQRRAWAEEQALNPDVIEKLYRDLVGYFISQELKQWQNET